MVDYNTKGGAKAASEGVSIYENARLLVISGIVLCALFAIAIAVWMSLSISKGLRSGITLAESVAIGDLERETHYKQNDEIRDLMNAMQQMTANLRETARVADQIANGD